MQKNSFLIIDGKPDKISKNAVSYQMSLVAFTLYIIINLRKESDKKSENAYCFRNIYVPGLFDTSKTYMLFVTLILFLYIMRILNQTKYP